MQPAKARRLAPAAFATGFRPGGSRPPAILNDASALAQSDRSARPAFAGDAVGGERKLVVLDASDVFDDALAVRRPGIDAESEVSSRRHRSNPLSRRW